jgi:hypothetical protein
MQTQDETVDIIIEHVKTLNKNLKTVSIKRLPKIADEKSFLIATNAVANNNNKDANKAFAKFIILQIDRTSQSSKFRDEIEILNLIAKGVNFSKTLYKQNIILFNKLLNAKTNASSEERAVLNMLLNFYQMLAGVDNPKYCTCILEHAQCKNTQSITSSIQDLKGLFLVTN